MNFTRYALAVELQIALLQRKVRRLIHGLVGLECLYKRQIGYGRIK